MVKPARLSLTQLWPYLLLVFATLVLLYPVIFTRAGSFCILSDNRQQAYPWFNKLATSLHKGYLPVWDANTYAGRSFAGELQTGIFYPLSIIWCLVFGSAKGIDVYYLDLLVCLHYLICLIGMYRVGRLFQLPPLAATCSALIFTFTSALSARSGGQTCIFFGLCLLPWAVYFVGRYYLQKRHKKYLIWSGIIGGLGILAGHIQPFFHTMLIIGIMILFYEYRARKDWKKFLLPCLGAISLIIVFALLISLPQDYYAVEYFRRCYRYIGGMHYLAMGKKLPLDLYISGYILQPGDLVNLLGRDLNWPNDDNLIYMGILPLVLLVLYSLKSKFLKLSAGFRDLSHLSFILLAIGVFCSLGRFTFVAMLMYHIPLVNTVRELGRYIVLISFGGSLLVGLAITYIVELKQLIFRPPFTIQFYLLLALIANAFYLIVSQPPEIPLDISIPFLLCFAFFLGIMILKDTSILPFAALAVIFIDLFLNPVSYSPTNTLFYPTHFYAKNRIFDRLEKSYGLYRVTFHMNNTDLERRNLGNVYDIQTRDGQGATLNNRFYDFTHFTEGSNAEIQDLLNIRYVLSDHQLDSNFSFIDSLPYLQLYERKNYYPRIYWKQQLGRPGKEIEAENGTSIHQLAYGDQYQKVEIECSSPDTLVFSENYYPGWKCFDNQKEIPIYQATIRNYPPLFRCISLKNGHHIIEFRYNKIFYWF